MCVPGIPVCVAGVVGDVATWAGGAIGLGVGVGAGMWILNNQKPPSDAKNKEGAKAPGKPCEGEGFKDPKGGEQWGKAPNGDYGWVDSKGNVWVPTGPGGHGGPHWDVQKPDGGYDNVYPGGNVRPGGQ